jgi:hypothetical protein
MKRRSQARVRPGFLLIEVICWLPLLAALLVLFTEMMVSGLKIYRQTTARDVMIGRVDSALATMRRDAWRAESIQAIKDQVVFVEPDGVIFWRVENGKVLTRVDASGTLQKKTWIEMPKFAFSAVGPLLKVEVESGLGAARRESMTLASQRMLAGGVP